MQYWVRKNVRFVVVTAALSLSLGPATTIAFAVAASSVLGPPEAPPQRLVRDPSLDPLVELPDRAFVLNDSAIVLSKPFLRSYAPSTQFLSWGNTLTVSGEVTAARLIVVDDNDDIVGVWSNTAAGDSTFYSLVTRLGYKNGPEHPLTDSILYQYSQLIDLLDWNARGQVYAR